MSLSEADVIADLRASYEKFGPLRSCVKTKYGIAAGETRLRAVPEWKTVFREVKSYYEHLQIAAADNIHSIKPAMWWEKIIKEAAGELAKEGVEKGKIVERLEKDFPLSRNSLYRYLPEEFKNPDKVKAGLASGAVRAVPTNGTELNLAKLRREIPGSFNRPEAETHLVGGFTPHPIRPEIEHRKAYTPEHVKMMNALSGYGFNVKTEFPVPMNKWKCGKCRQTWIEDPPKACPKCGVEPEQLTYYIDILLDDRWAVEPGGKHHDFDSDEARDAHLREKGYEPFHYANDLVNHGAWLIAEYHKLLKQSESKEEHTLLIEGPHVRHVYHNQEEIHRPMQFETGAKATIRIVIR